MEMTSLPLIFSDQEIKVLHLTLTLDENVIYNQKLILSMIWNYSWTRQMLICWETPTNTLKILIIMSVECSKRTKFLEILLLVKHSVVLSLVNGITLLVIFITTRIRRVPIHFHRPKFNQSLNTLFHLWFAQIQNWMEQPQDGNYILKLKI